VIVTLLLVKRRRMLVWIVLALIAAVIFIPNPVRDTVLRGVVADPYILMRPGIWMESLRMAGDHAIAGVGPSSFHFAAHAYIPPTDFLLVRHSHIPNIAHNAYLQALAEFGIVGFLPLAILLLALLLVIWRALRGREPEDPGWPLRMGLAAGFVGLLVHSFVDNLIANRAIVLIMLFAAAPLARWVALDARAGRLHRFLRRDRIIAIAPLLAPTGLVAGGMFIIWFFAVQVAAPLYYEQRMHSLRPAVNAAAVGSPDAAPILALREEMIDLSRYYPDNLALCRALAQVERALFLRSGDVQHFSEGVAWYERAERMLGGVSAGDAFSALALHFDLIERGHPKTVELLERMRSLAQRAIAAWPNRAAYHHLAAMIERESGNLDAARSHIERAVALEPNFLMAYAELERIAGMQGNAVLAGQARGQYDAALMRIRTGPPPERDDAYAWQIIRPAR
jgi:tetratricopeptide (TPR) repeat protein